jgi:hypothetical protein
VWDRWSKGDEPAKISPAMGWGFCGAVFGGFMLVMTVVTACKRRRHQVKGVEVKGVEVKGVAGAEDVGVCDKV